MVTRVARRASVLLFGTLLLDVLSVCVCVCVCLCVCVRSHIHVFGFSALFSLLCEGRPVNSLLLAVIHLAASGKWSQGHAVGSERQ